MSDRSNRDTGQKPICFTYCIGRPRDSFVLTQIHSLCAELQSKCGYRPNCSYRDVRKRMLWDRCIAGRLKGHELTRTQLPSKAHSAVKELAALATAVVAIDSTLAGSDSPTGLARNSTPLLPLLQFSTAI